MSWLKNLFDKYWGEKRKQCQATAESTGKQCSFKEFIWGSRYCRKHQPKKVLAVAGSVALFTAVLKFSLPSGEQRELRELRRIQSLTADLKVAIIREGGGWKNGMEIQPGAVVFIPTLPAKTNFSFHLKLTNQGQAPAENIQIMFRVDSNVVMHAFVFGPEGWRDESSGTLEYGFTQYALQIEALYPSNYFMVQPAITIESSPRYTNYSVGATLSIYGRNMAPIALPIEFFFYDTTQLRPAYVSTNRLSWKQ
jgi:hypothetical protein